jgi:PadR family transcriptional regulator, regulatory protein PadR
MPPIAEFELRVLLAVMQSGVDAYAVRVHQELEERTKRAVAIGAVYITLDRLVRKGWLASKLGEPSPERGGKAKRFYSVTARGKVALRSEIRAMHRLWQGLNVVPEA